MGALTVVQVQQIPAWSDHLLDITEISCSYYGLFQIKVARSMEAP